MPLIEGFHHVALKACGKQEFDRTCAFYSEILGCPIVSSWGEGDKSAAMLKCGDGLFEIFACGREQGAEGAIRHLALATDQVDVCIEKVRNAGYKVTLEPMDVVLNSTPPMYARVAFCIGPVGETIEFFYEK